MIMNKHKQSNKTFIDRCNIAMEERRRRDVSDQYSWWCRQCKSRKSIRTGSFFERSKLTAKMVANGTRVGKRNPSY